MSNKCDYKLPYDACASDIFVDVTEGAVHRNVYCGPSEIGQIRVPVKVAIVDVTKCLMDSVFINEGFEDIKHIHRRVFLTQCHVTNKFLFVEGYVEKNIGYATPIANPSPEDCHDECRVIKNTYNDCTVKVDFSFCIPVCLHHDDMDASSPLKERAYHVDCTKPCDEGGLGEVGCERGYSKRVFLNEPIKGVLEEYEFNESVFLKKTCHDTAWRYDTVVEKLELTLVIALLQVQQLSPGPTPMPPCQ